MRDLAILRPQDCLRRSLPHRQPPNRYHMKKPQRSPKPNPKFNPKKSNCRTRIPEKTKKNSSRTCKSKRAITDNSPTKNSSGLVLGQVKILKRGEELKELNSQANQVTVHVDEKKKVQHVPKQRRLAGFYAGSAALISSPPPSSLPLPAFVIKKSTTDDDATTDLLRLLHLDLP